MNKRRKIRAAKVARKLAEPSAVEFGTKKTILELGSSGTDVMGGMFREEFLPDLQGTRAAQAYDKMRRREANVAMLLDAIKNPIKSANWSWEVEDENDPVQLKMKRLCEWNFCHGIEEGWEQFLTEALTLIDFGYSVFEVVHTTDVVPELAGWDKPEEKPEAEMPEMPEAPEAEVETPATEAPDVEEVPEEDASPEEDAQAEDEGPAPTVTYYKKFAFRKQTSIYRWLLERKTGKIIGIEQQTMGDTSKETLVVIPGQFCLVFTNKKEGDNYEGISALRPLYGAYLRKDLYLRLTAIGAEKNAVGTVIGTTPASKSNSEEDAKFEAVLEAYAGNESAYIKKPEGWEVEIQYGQFDPQKMVTLLNFENEEMSKSLLASFLNLGTGGNSAGLAVGGTLSNFFLNAIQSYANIIANRINRDAAPALCKLNLGPQKCYPKLKCTGINDKAGKELADIILTLTNAQALTPDSKMEDFLRQQYKLPKADPATKREKAPQLPGLTPMGPDGKPMPPPEGGKTAAPGAKAPGDTKAPPGTPTPGSDGPGKEAKQASERIQFAEGYKTQFNSGKDGAKALMQTHLRKFADDLKAKAAKNWEALGEKQKDSAVKDVSISPGLLSAYKRELRDHMASVATKAIQQARKEVPSAAKVKFGDYDKLNPIVKRAIESQLGLVVDSQASDITKVVLFQFASSAASRTNVDGILTDVEEKVQPILDGTVQGGMSIEAAAGDLTAQVTQNSRNSFFFEPEVLDKIESFTFTNEDPVSEICQNLNGQTFLATDPDAEQFYPPLHHNCKSRLVPNEKGEDVKVTGIGITADTVEERQRLEKQITLGCC